MEQIEMELDDPLNTVRDRIRYLRKLYNLSQEEVAIGLNKAGIKKVGRTYITGLEVGRCNVTHQMIMALSIFYGVDPKWIEKGVGEAPTKIITNTQKIPYLEKVKIAKNTQKIPTQYYLESKRQREKKLAFRPVAKRIKLARIELGLKQEEVAILMGTKGDGSFISKVEMNNVVPKKPWLEKFCAALYVDIDYILTGKRAKKQKSIFTNENVQPTLNLELDVNPISAVEQVEIFDQATLEVTNTVDQQVEIFDQATLEVTNTVDQQYSTLIGVPMAPIPISTPTIDLRKHFQDFVQKTGKMLNLSDADVIALFEFFTAK